LLNDQFGRLFHLPLELSKNGHQVKVVALDYRHSIGETYECGSLQISSYPTKALGASLLLSQNLQYLFTFAPDFVVGSGHINTAYLAWRIALKLNAKFIFDLYDEYSTFPTCCMIPGIAKIQSMLIQKAAKTIVVSQKLKEKLKVKENAIVIENGVDTSLFKPIAKSFARKELNIPEHHIIIGYFGSLQKRLGTHILLEAISRLRKDNADMFLLLAGNNCDNFKFANDSVNYLGSLPQTRIPTLIAACDLVVIPYPESPQNNVSTACKIPEYLACQIPVVCTRIANYSDYFSESSFTLCEPGNVEALMEQIKVQLKEREICPFPEELKWHVLGKKLETFLLPGQT